MRRILERRAGTFDTEGREVGWLREGPMDGRPVMVLAHGAGAPMTSAFMVAVAAGLVSRGLVVVRFNFPYMQRAQAEGRRRPPDRAPVLISAWREMLRRVLRMRGCGPVTVGGKSLGARMASMLLAGDPDLPVRSAVWLGYPLHPAGRPERLRRDHLPHVAVPQLFVSGSRDPLARIDLLRATVADLGRRASLHLVDGGDHSLATSRRQPLEGADAWLDVVARFLAGTRGG